MADYSSDHSHGLKEGEQVRVRVRRQLDARSEPYWEEFEVPFRTGANVISLLMEIQRRPVTVDGKTVAPVAWDASCLEEVCGACSMVINGKVRQACSALVEKLGTSVTLEPMGKFPLVRDLAVDRERMFESLKRLKCWIPIDGTYDLGPGPRQAPGDQQVMYVLSTCMTCGCCMEACPQFNDSTGFVGAAPISQVRLFNMHPTGRMHAAERIRALAGRGGIQDCGKAQNCVQACPKNIPLTTSIAAMNRAATLQNLKDFFLGAEEGKAEGGQRA